MYIVSCNCSLAGPDACKRCSNNISSNIEDYFNGLLTTSTFNLNEDWWKNYVDTRKYDVIEKKEYKIERLKQELEEAKRNLKTHEDYAKVYQEYVLKAKDKVKEIEKELKELE